MFREFSLSGEKSKLTKVRNSEHILCLRGRSNGSPPLCDRVCLHVLGQWFVFDFSAREQKLRELSGILLSSGVIRAMVDVEGDLGEQISH